MKSLGCLVAAFALALLSQPVESARKPSKQSEEMGRASLYMDGPFE